MYHVALKALSDRSLLPLGMPDCRNATLRFLRNVHQSLLHAAGRCWCGQDSRCHFPTMCAASENIKHVTSSVGSTIKRRRTAVLSEQLG